MTTAVIEELQAAGFVFEINGDALRIHHPPGAMTTEVRNRITRHKPEIMAALVRPSPSLSSDESEPVTCRDCQHFTPDQVNPPAGMGDCRINADGDPGSPGYHAPWPTLSRRCQSFEVTRAAVFRECKAACKRLQVDPSALCDWLINQADPGWLLPTAVRRWAELIEQRGGFPSD